MIKRRKLIDIDYSYSRYRKKATLQYIHREYVRDFRKRKLSIRCIDQRVGSSKEMLDTLNSVWYD